MDWVSNLFIALFFMDITGTLFFLIGILFSKIWFKHDTKFLRFMVITTLCGYTVPFVYLVLYMNKRIAVILAVRSNLNLFYNTPTTKELFSILGTVWIVMFLLLLVYRLFRHHRWVVLCRGNIPEEDKMVERRFRDICAELGIKDKVALYRNDSIKIACTTYHHGPMVILPFVKYKEEEIDVILYHELCHYLERDVYLKTWSVLVTLLHVFNPLAHILLYQMDLICEECCDRLACEKGNEIFTTQEYFRVIFDMLLTDGKRERYQLLALVDSRSNYERRVKYMSEYLSQGKMKKRLAVVLSVGFLLGSSMTALAAGNELTDAYEDITKETSEKTSILTMENTDEQTFEELCRAYDLDPDKVVMMEDDNIEARGRVFNVEWDVPADTTYMTSGFRESEGDEVSVTVAGTPEDITFQTGIKDPNEIMIYVEGEDVVFHTFDIEINGRYYFFVTNMSETEKLYVQCMVVK